MQCDSIKFASLSVWKLVWVHKRRKNWSILTKFWYVFAISNINLCTKNCGHMLNTIYRVTSNSWIFLFIYVPLSKCLCDNTNVIKRTGSITGSELRPTASKFGAEILEKVFEESSKIFFHKSKQISFKYFSKKKFRIL